MIFQSNNLKKRSNEKGVLTEPVVRTLRKNQLYDHIQMRHMMASMYLN